MGFPRRKDLGLKTAREVGDIPRATVVSPHYSLHVRSSEMIITVDLPKSTGLEITPGWTNVLKRCRYVPIA